MLRGIGAVLSFLTILPSRGADLPTIARYMYLFPAAGLVIGAVVGGIGLGLSFVLEPLLVGLLVAASAIILTGVHHTDGLADFADGLLAKGAKQDKIAAMRDPYTGSGGIVAVVLYVAGLVAAVSLTDGTELLRGIILSEILAKFSMVMTVNMGCPAALSSSSPFVEMMKDKKRLTAASLIMLVLVALIGQITGLIMLGITIMTTIIILIVSARSFGGITGDVLGATNELSRLSSLVVFVSI